MLLLDVIVCKEGDVTVHSLLGAGIHKSNLSRRCLKCIQGSPGSPPGESGSPCQLQVRSSLPEIGVTFCLPALFTSYQVWKV